MKTLTRHLLYLALFLALLLFVAGLTLFREMPVIDVILGVLAMITTVVGVGWVSYQINRPSKPSSTGLAYHDKKTVLSTSELVDQD